MGQKRMIYRLNLTKKQLRCSASKRKSKRGRRQSLRRKRAIKMMVLVLEFNGTKMKMNVPCNWLSKKAKSLLRLQELRSSKTKRVKLTES